MLSKLAILSTLLLLLFTATQAFAGKTEAGTESAGIEVMSAFTSVDVVEGEAVVIEEKTKRLIMFIMGVPLLLLLLTTAGLGIAMGVYGKPVYVAHMVCAGLSLTLAMGHAVVGIVWFYPF